MEYLDTGYNYQSCQNRPIVSFQRHRFPFPREKSTKNGDGGQDWEDDIGTEATSSSWVDSHVGRQQQLISIQPRKNDVSAAMPGWMDDIPKEISSGAKKTVEI